VFATKGQLGGEWGTSVNMEKLENHLWEAANILRGPVDAADFKTYVFPLLFFKRISDVHDEEHVAALAEAEAESKNTHIIVERIVADIDDIVKKVRFPDWQRTTQGERLVQKELRKTLLKYKLHTDQELFDKAYGYVRQYY
jgi:type I restriction-modification system DNA methylase subunit